MLRPDFPHFLDILVAEDILNLSDALEFVSELGGFCVAREFLVNRGGIVPACSLFMQLN